MSATDASSASSERRDDTLRHLPGVARRIVERLRRTVPGVEPVVHVIGLALRLRVLRRHGGAQAAEKDGGEQKRSSLHRVPFQLYYPGFRYPWLPYPWLPCIREHSDIRGFRYP